MRVRRKGFRNRRAQAIRQLGEFDGALDQAALERGIAGPAHLFEAFAGFGAQLFGGVHRQSSFEKPAAVCFSTPALPR